MNQIDILTAWRSEAITLISPLGFGWEEVPSDMFIDAHRV